MCRKVSFWWIWCTVPRWSGTLTILWSDEREGSRSTRWRQHSRDRPGTSTTGGEGVDDGHHPSERRNRWFDYPITTLSPTVDHADNRIDDEAMMAWFEGYSNKTDTTSPVDGSDMFETNLIEIIKTVCKWRQRQHCLSQYSRRRSRRVYQYDLKNRVREHD